MTLAHGLATGRVARTRTDRRGVDPWLGLAPAVALLLFAAGNQNFGFDPPGWLDGFMYLGYFWHYPEHPALLDGYYKGSRLPWVLPGYVAHWLFDAVTASYLLHWATLSASGVALYLLLRDTLHDRAVAGLMSVAWVTCTQVHGVGGWNYHMVAASAYYMAGCWALVRAASSPSRWAAIPAGALLACAIHTHLFFVAFLPLAVTLYAARYDVRRAGWLRHGAAQAAAAVAGAAGITGLLAAINAGTGGQWLFFMPQVEYTRWLSALPASPWLKEMADWLPRATYLVIPVLAALVGTASLVRARARAGAMELVFVGQLWAALALLTYYHVVERQSVLDHEYIAFVLYCHAFPALAVAVTLARRDSTPHPAGGRLALAGAGVLAAALLLAPQTFAAWHWLVTAAGLSGVPVVAAGIAGALVLTAAALWPARAAVLIWATALSVINVAVAPWSRPYGIGTPGIHREMLVLFRDLDRTTSRLDPALNGIEYWFTAEQVETPQGPVNLTDVFDSYVSTRQWAANLLSPGSELPLEQIDSAHVQNASCIGLLSSATSHARLEQQLTRRLEALGYAPQPLLQQPFSTEHLAIRLTVFALAARDGDARRSSCGG